MPSYMTIVVLALATSNVPVALSVPVYPSREVREQSLSRREDLPQLIRPPLPGHPVQPANSPTEPGSGPEAEPPKKAVGSGSGVNMKQVALNFVVGITSSLFAASIFQDIAYMTSRSVPATSSTTSTGSTSSADQDAQHNSYKSTPQSGQAQYEYGQYPSQQRAVDHGKNADSGSFEAKIRSISDNNRRLELLTRAEFGEALKPFTRVLDELD